MASNEREPGGRWVPSGKNSSDDANRKPDSAASPDDTLTKIQKVLEARLDQLATKPHDASISTSDIASLAKLLMTIMEENRQREEQQQRNKTTPDDAELDAIVEVMTDDEDERFLWLHDEIEGLKNSVRGRLGLPPRAIEPPHRYPRTSTFHFISGLVHLRDDQLTTLIDRFVATHAPLRASWKKEFEQPLANEVSRILIDLLDRNTLRSTFEDEVEKFLRKYPAKASLFEPIE